MGGLTSLRDQMPAGLGSHRAVVPCSRLSSASTASCPRLLTRQMVSGGAAAVVSAGAASVSQRPCKASQRSSFNLPRAALHARNPVEHFQDVTVLIGRALAFNQWRQLVEAVVDITDVTRQPSAMSEELFGLPLCRTNARG